MPKNFVTEKGAIVGKSDPGYLARQNFMHAVIERAYNRISREDEIDRQRRKQKGDDRAPRPTHGVCRVAHFCYIGASRGRTWHSH